MDKVFDAFKDILMGIAAVVAVFIIYLVIPLGFMWLVVCAFVWAISLCFGLTFSWLYATGIWLILMLVAMFVGRGSRK